MGGARAAALAYAVLEALKETPVEVNGQARTLFSELDVVSAVSGGSLAAAYLGAFTFRELARADRVGECRPGAIAAADRLFATTAAPWCSTMF